MPFLWNKKHEAYKNKDIRHDGNKVLEVYKEFDSNATVKSMVKKIQNLRTGYFKELKKVKESSCTGAGAEEVYVPTLWYFDALSFLRSVSESCRTGRDTMETEVEMSIILRTRFAPADIVETTVSNALKLGYKHIDTAFNYNNEEAIGKAIKTWINSGEGTRDDLFITTKLPHVANRASDVRRFVEMQLERLQLDYLNLYLIHVPFGFHCDPEKLTPVVLENGDYSLDMETNHISTWKAMEICHKDGLISNLGLSNFNQQQIMKINKEADIKPQVLQVELHTQFQQNPLRTFCMENNIIVTAYAPLGSPGAKDHFVTKYNYNPDTFPNLLGHPNVKEIAAKHNKTPAQILLNFLISQGVVVIPKSTSEARLKENMDIYDFVLSPEEIRCLKNLDRGEEGRIFNFLFWKGVEKHPEYPFPEQLKTIEGIQKTQ